ncbi:DUF2185 domain-containing protein [Paenibacillus sp. MER 180]|uniref:immunity protein Imm33 domain-containing protein n=1 Tax=Paenibacillus sp. MER 180 TaxID=2939570 RepID=UPI00203F0B83|nr:DUF2185 domain-containing protein [Paenibacillus sp. MER 180]MCM3293159.1 DUF2185 domain-containing protein [Paenibacillus sp. MER 180]
MRTFSFPVSSSKNTFIYICHGLGKIRHTMLAAIQITTGRNLDGVSFSLCTQKVVVTNDVLERNEFNFMARDFPNEGSDTGWSFFTGYEEENDPDDIDNYQFISIGKVLNIDDSILSFINREPQCAFERNLETKEFYEVFDYEWEE